MKTSPIARVGCLLLSVCCAASEAADQVLVEAESFEQHGGWSLDTQFIQVSAASMRESHPHDIVITQEAPNYSTEYAIDET